jgi:DHA3 family macrolide efflux protein-like MFS transporter
MFATRYRVLVPQEKQGRFFGLMRSLGRALVPVGAALTGWLVEMISPFSVAGCAGGIVIALAIWNLARPGLRAV